MLTPSVLPNSPLGHPLKNPISTAPAGDTEAMQASESAGFGRLLAKQMGDESDVSEAGLADISTPIQASENSISTAEDAEQAGVLVNQREDAPNQKNARKIKSASAISVTPQLTEFANVLPNLLAGQPTQIAAGISAAGGAHAGTGHQTETQAIYDQDYKKAEDGVGAVPQGKGKAGTPADPLTEVLHVEGERQGAAVDYVALAGQPPGLVSGNFAKAATGAKPDISDMAAVHRAAPQIAGLSAGPSAGVAVGLMAGVQDEAPTTGRSATLQSGTAIRFDVDTRKNDSSRPELNLTERFSSEPAKLPNVSSDAFSQNPSAIQAGAGLSAVAAEGSPAPVSTAPASLLDHFAPILEHRFGSPGWDNALSQKVLWMVSQQQQIVELSLNPPDLGPLQVVLSVNNDQASAMFISQNADVRQALEAALPRLKEMMADSGVSLGNTTVSSDSSQQSTWLEGSGRQNHSGAQNSGAPMSTSDDGRINIAGIGVSGLVDTFA